MELIDDNGRVLGVVNLIDGLVILLVVAVVATGVALVLQPEPSPPTPPETETVTAFLDLGPQPEFIARELSAGDVYTPTKQSKLTVTDVYVIPQDNASRAFLTVELTGVVSGDSITFAEAPPRLGRNLTVATDKYQVSGVIRDVGGQVTTASTEVVLAGTVSASTATAIQRGDTYTVAGHDVATVESVRVFGTANPDVRRVFLGLSLDTVRLENGPQFGDTVVRPGALIPFRMDGYTLTGTVRRVGATDLRGEPATRTVTLRMTGVPPTFGDNLRAGMTETVAGETTARITAVETEPATVVLTSQDGNIFLREHPVDEDVTLTAELQIRETATGPTFKGQSLRRGDTVVLDLGTTTVEATVVSL